MPRVAFDTNVLAYAAGLRMSDADEPKVVVAERLVRELLADQPLILPVQVCLEFHRLFVRKRGLTSEQASEVLRYYMTEATIIASDAELLETALNLAERHHLQTYDAVILAASVAARCAILYSEDMQHGFAWGGVMVVNPFA